MRGAVEQWPRTSQPVVAPDEVTVPGVTRETWSRDDADAGTVRQLRTAHRLWGGRFEGAARRLRSRS